VREALTLNVNVYSVAWMHVFGGNFNVFVSTFMPGYFLIPFPSAVC